MWRAVSCYLGPVVYGRLYTATTRCKDAGTSNMRAALNRPGSDCRPLRMPATRIGRVLATLRPRDRRDAPAPILASLGPARPGPGRRTWETALDTPHQRIAKCYAVRNLRTSSRSCIGNANAKRDRLPGADDPASGDPCDGCGTRPRTGIPPCAYRLRNDALCLQRKL